MSEPLTRYELSELHAEPALWHLQDYRRIDATVQKLLRELDDAHAYGYSMEGKLAESEDRCRSSRRDSA